MHLKSQPLIIIAFLAISFSAFSQAPNLLNYQGVARNNVGNPLPNQTMKLRLSIRNLLPSGAVVYSEIRQITTNMGGLFSVKIGSVGAISTIGTMAGINWVEGDKFLQVELDPASNSNYLDIGTVQLVSVPYALAAGNAATVKTNANLTGVVTSVGNQTSITNGAITSDMIESLNKSKVGLDLVNNTSDAAKPISTATQAALDLKANTATIDLKENTANKSINTTLGTSDVLFPTQNAVKTYVDTKISAAAVSAETLEGTNLASNVIGSSLTSVGTLSNLTVTNPIVGNINGNAATATTATEAGTASTATKLATAKNINGVAFDGSRDITLTANAGTLTGTTLSSNVVYSSLTNVGILTNLTVTNPIGGSITGNAATATTAITAGTSTTATKLATGRNINGVPFDGTSDITLTADAGTLTGTTLASNVVNSSLAGVGTITSGTWSGTVIDVKHGGTGTNDGSITGTGTLTFAAGGLNQNGSIISIIPSGTLTGTGSVGVGTISPTSSAALDVSSTTKGFLPPRMTTSQRDAITNPDAGLTIWNKTNVQLEVYDGSYWVNMNGKLVSTLTVGQSYGGGKVAYVFTSSDPGYVAGQTHGLIAAESDQSTDLGVKWFPNSAFYGATAISLGQGSFNTLSIITAATAASADLSSYAAGLASSYSGGGYTDWYLPSKEELNKLYGNRAAIGGFATTGTIATYWSSSQKGSLNYSSLEKLLLGISSAYQQFFFTYNGNSGGTQSDLGITNTRRVRAIRSF